MADQPLGVRPCSVAAALDILGERWSLLAIREIGYGVHRFARIAAYTGASRDMLADRLRKLESAGIIERRRYSEHPPRFEYHLTEACLRIELPDTRSTLCYVGRSSKRRLPRYRATRQVR